MWVVLLLSRAGDGTTELVEMQLDNYAHCTASKGDTEAAVFAFEDEDEAHDFRENVVLELRDLDVFFRARKFYTTREPEELMLDTLAREE